LILAYSSTSGFLLLLEIIRPRYLNSSTVFTDIYPIFNISTLFTYMAFVFLAFIVKLLSVQNYTKQSVRRYNSPGEGASSTKSSANASKKIYNEAIVYARRLVPSILLFL